MRTWQGAMARFEVDSIEGKLAEVEEFRGDMTV
jgi:hypothetical protein